ncbi:hypothetical protein Tco_0627695 [Tanacetum coccineum]|uniref:Reverse transcriptase Ty1/copia-type domain-containing protein n=1 Tax=Tanacetum coccineum TaxID=301880 RepID=A0ABQ4WNC5_9ASTR
MSFDSSTIILRLLNKRLKELQAQAQAQVLRTWLLCHLLAVLMKLIVLMELVLLTLKLALLALNGKLALPEHEDIRRFFSKKPGRKFTINGSDTVGYDKSKVECFNFHKMGYFAREFRGPRNQDSRNRNQDNSRRTVNVEETSSKAMLAIYGAGFDWSYMADDEVPTNMALMAFLDSKGHLQKEDQVYVDSGCSRHVTRNMSYLSDFKEFDGGYMCDNKNNVLFTDTRCFVLFPDFKLADESQNKFRCHVAILNTLDYLGKFDGNSDEGFFIGYSMNSKAFRYVDKLAVDIDVLTKSMNYVPVVAGRNSNDYIGTEESIGASHSSKETGSSQDYILMPLWKDGSLFNSSSKKASNDEPQPSSDAGKKDDEVTTARSNGYQTEPDMFSLGDNATLEATHADFFGDETEVDMSNITTTYPVPSTLNTRIYKDHSLDHVIGDVQSGVQTRRMTKTTNEQGFINPSWIEAMQDELLQFKLQQVWPLVDLPHGKRAIVARIEAIRLFLAYASFKDFVVYQMDMKSAFLYIKELKEFIRVEKALYVYIQLLEPGLQVTQKDDGIFISQDKYVDEILKKFGFLTIWLGSIPIETSKPLLKDTEAEDVYVHLYRSMIGSLMYLTASRLDIIFALCACARFQVTPKVSHLHAVKRIFRYLKDRKSTTGGCQFLGSRLISWQCKKQTVVSNSTTEAEYVAASSCCGQVLWIQNQMLDYGYNFMNIKIFINNESTIWIVKNPLFHSKTKHIEIRHHFIRDSNKKKLIQMIKIHTDQNVVDLLTKAFNIGRFQYLIASIGMLNP